MAPYPFARSQPASSSTPKDRPIVVSASGRGPASPANLTADSPSFLRSRLSPRNPDIFQNDSSSYPSPSEAPKGKRKKPKGWTELPSSSPIPKYDSRGYPTRGPPDPPILKHSTSSTSISSVSTTGAGVGENGRFLSPEKPTTFTEYPPINNYALSAHSYQPYDKNPSPEPSLYGESRYGDSRVSLERSRSAVSDNSMTHFKKYDVVGQEFSISSKGGRKHLADMVCE